jgi:nicotinate dehydrogenase subunit A
MAELKLTVNGRLQTLDVEPDMPLLNLLNEDLGLNGPKFGCGLSQCGACTVLLEGEPIRSCVTPCSASAGKKVTTIEGLGTQKAPHRLQQLFIEEQAVQCGYCISGIMLYGKTFVDSNPKASREDIIKSLSGLICRCHAHSRMVRALERYAQEVSK